MIYDICYDIHPIPSSLDVLWVLLKKGKFFLFCVEIQTAENCACTANSFRLLFNSWIEIITI